MRLLPPCDFRGPERAPGRWDCRCPQLFVAGGAVAREHCLAPCPYRRAREPGPNTNDEPSLREFLLRVARPNHGFPAGWQYWPVARAAQRQLLDAALEAEPPQPPGAGRGIVIAAGGPLYFRLALTAAEALRRCGCRLPIEFWHLGPAEISKTMARVAAPLDVVCRDAFEICPQPRLLHGWGLKAFAIQYSRFAEVLFMDADNLAFADPTPLFDDPEFLATGAIFWPDVPSPNWVPPQTYAIAGISDPRPPAFETGQILLDKIRSRRALHATMHLNAHSDFWYSYVYGDKDTFKLAWDRLRQPYAMPSRPPEWVHPAILQFDLQGRLMFTHCCQGKQEILAGERLNLLGNAAAILAAGRAARRRFEAALPWEAADV